MPQRKPIDRDDTPAALIARHCSDILASPGMAVERDCIQHGDTSVLAHSAAVTAHCALIARSLQIPVDERALMRGAILHDYFLYDWHDPDPSHRLHGYTHPGTACRNAALTRQLATSCPRTISSPLPLTPGWVPPWPRPWPRLPASPAWPASESSKSDWRTCAKKEYTLWRIKVCCPA